MEMVLARENVFFSDILSYSAYCSAVAVGRRSSLFTGKNICSQQLWQHLEKSLEAGIASEWQVLE